MAIDYKPEQNKYKNMTPFKTWLMYQINTWGVNNFPFLENDFDQLTNYGMMMKLMKALNDNITNQNLVEEDMTKLYEAFTELQTYIDNYFDNLDIQTEVNNKLDEMAVSGELADIIAQYLKVASVLAYDTKASLKSANNLVNGSITRTLGESTYNDGKGSYYKIRTLTSSDVIDDNNILALANFPTLIAEKIPNPLDTPINVLLNGVKGDGITDDTLAIQTLIDNNPNRTIYFPEATYLISQPLVTPANYLKSVQLKLDKYAIIKADNNFIGDYVIDLGGKDNNDQSMYNIGVLYGIDGGIIDCNNITGGIKVYGISPTVTNCEIRNCSKIGVYLPFGMHNSSADAFISNLHIFGNNSLESIGLKCEASDNTFEDIRIYTTQIGVHETHGGNYFKNIHCLYSNDNLTNYNSSIGFYIKSWNNSFYQCYSDQYSTGFYIDGKYRNYFYTPCVVYWQGGNYSHTAFYCNGSFACFIDNPFIEFKDNEGINTVLKLIQKNNPEGNITNLHISNRNYLTLLDEECFNPLYNYSYRKINTNDIITSGSFINNNIAVNNGIVNFSINITNLTVNKNTNTIIMNIPVGFRPAINCNLLVNAINTKDYNHILSWINSDGEVHIDSSIDISTPDVLNIYGTYTIL